MAHGSLQGRVVSTIRERIWCHVDDAHDFGDLQVNQKTGGLPVHLKARMGSIKQNGAQSPVLPIVTARGAFTQPWQQAQM